MLVTQPGWLLSRGWQLEQQQRIAREKEEKEAEKAAQRAVSPLVVLL